jgi:hypothetical protein
MGERMVKITRSAVLIALAIVSFGALSAQAADPPSIPSDCSKWTLDGYHIGMLGTELLAVRSVTLHVEGQAQVVEPGRFHGVLVLDALNRVQKWDVVYQTTNGDPLRAELRARFGDPASDVSGDASATNPEGGHQRRTIWRSKACDVAIILYDLSGGHGSQGQGISASLVRASTLKPGFVEMKTLFH